MTSELLFPCELLSGSRWKFGKSFIADLHCMPREKLIWRGI